MAQVTFDIKGTKEVSNMLKQFGKEGRKIAADITEINAKDIERDAKKLAVVDTGKMRQGVVAEKIKPSAWTITAYEVYSSFIEFGTRYISARPFLYPSWKSGAIKYTTDMRNAFVNLTKKYN
jgi:HK97 gp10 family phage protein